MALSISEQLSQLQAARQIVLSDPSLYPQIVNGVLPIINADAEIEMKRWGARFLAESFASPVITPQNKEQMALQALPTLKGLLECVDPEDSITIQATVEASASIYELVFKYIIENPTEVTVWTTMTAIKSEILRRWDKSSKMVKICCIKFVQKVVQIQTPGTIADPRRPLSSETSVAIVPRDHPLIPPSRLEPEAFGLLDRLLDIFCQETHDAVLVTATLNCLGVLIRTRQTTTSKIVAAVLALNPFKMASESMNSRTRVFIKSMERTLRSLLMNIYRRNESSPLVPRIKQHVERLNQCRASVLEEAVNRKRGSPADSNPLNDQHKRRKLSDEPPESQGHKLSAESPNTIAQVFTLTTDAVLASFDVNQLPQPLVVSITQGLLSHINPSDLDTAINMVRARLAYKTKAIPVPVVLGDDEEDYEPDFDEPMEDREQILNRVDAMPYDVILRQDTEMASGPFDLGPPPALSAAEMMVVGQNIIKRVFVLLHGLTAVNNVSSTSRLGLNRLAGNNNDREAWLTFVIRLATRASAGLDAGETSGHEDLSYPPGTRSRVGTQENPSDKSLDNIIRESLWHYIVEDFRARISTAIAWLNEEWYNDQIQYQRHNAQPGSSRPAAQYEIWVLRILDAIIPYLDVKDKLLIRFLSEIPVLSMAVLERVKNLAQDPERIALAVRALHYLILLKPPAREQAINAVEDLWRNNEDARPLAAKLLIKWRPGVVPVQSAAVPTGEQGDGVVQGKHVDDAESKPIPEVLPLQAHSSQEAGLAFRDNAMPITSPRSAEGEKSSSLAASATKGVTIATFGQTTVV